jgi:hypothetical protein
MVSDELRLMPCRRDLHVAHQARMAKDSSAAKSADKKEQDAANALLGNCKGPPRVLCMSESAATRQDVAFVLREGFSMAKTLWPRLIRKRSRNST